MSNAENTYKIAAISAIMTDKTINGAIAPLSILDTDAVNKLKAAMTIDKDSEAFLNWS